MKKDPKIIVFCCNWCSYAGADNAGVAKVQIKPHFRIIRTMCSSRIDPELIIEAFKKGAWGVLVLGCHPGDCHYKNGNYKTLRKVKLLKRMLAQFGIEDDRLRLDWVSSNEGEKFGKVVNKMIDDIEKLGPLDLSYAETEVE
ncbi:hydrogenase iron-sulfur subunit [Candidatus Calescamantes bacterium]|nr:hydrogenase iron-sulfur subunit [bacterium]MCK5224476.1 hydrogenase iron-sulfur subunit [Candidatus Calescamantes bacterium]MCK5399507.1 hydrogenase iron-sulfur subunit [bacterium]MCK5599391.1 hydrogenase iron-sulfur subunit [bacterium]